MAVELQTRDTYLMHALFYSLVCMNLLFCSTLYTLVKPSVFSALVTSLSAILWLIWNGPLEGSTIWAFSAQHGVTESDLLSAVAIGITLRCVLTNRHTRGILNKNKNQRHRRPR